MRRPRQLILLVALTIGTAACDQKLSTLAGPTPDLLPTFSSIQKDIFEATDSSGRTTCVTCHTNVGRNPAGGLNLLHRLIYLPERPRASPESPTSFHKNPSLVSRAGHMTERSHRNLA